MYLSTTNFKAINIFQNVKKKKKMLDLPKFCIYWLTYTCVLNASSHFLVPCVRKTRTQSVLTEGIVVYKLQLYVAYVAVEDQLVALRLH